MTDIEKREVAVIIDSIKEIDNEILALQKRKMIQTMILAEILEKDGCKVELPD